MRRIVAEVYAYGRWRHSGESGEQDLSGTFTTGRDNDSITFGWHDGHPVVLSSQALVVNPEHSVALVDTTMPVHNLYDDGPYEAIITRHGQDWPLRIRVEEIP